MNYLLWVSFFSLFILGFGDNIRGPLFPEIIHSFGISDSLAAWYFALSSFMSFVGSILVRNFKTVSHLLWILYLGVFCIFLSFAIQHFAPSYSFVLTGVIFFGLSVGFLGFAQNNLVIIGTTKPNRSRMLAYLHSMYGVSSLLAPLYVAWLADLKWQQIILNVAWAALAFSVIGFVYNTKKAERIQHFSQFQEPSTSRLSSFSELKVSVAIAFYVLAEILISTRLAQYMRRYFNYSLSQSSLYVTLFFVFLLAGRMLTSFLPHHYNIKKQMFFSLFVSAVLIGAGLYIHPIGLALSGFGLAPFYPLSLSYISHVFPFKSTTIVSWTLSIQGAAVVLMHLGIGKVTDLMGLEFALHFGLLFLLISFVFLKLIREEEYA